MRNIFKFIALSFVMVLSSCGDAEEVIYDQNDTSQTLVRFANRTEDFPLPIGTTTTYEVQVQVSSLSDQDRTYEVELYNAETSENLDFTYESTVTVPANEYFGYFEVTATDNGIGDDVSFLTFDLIPNEGASFENTRTTIEVFQVCPVPEDRYTGTWNVSTNACLGNGSGACSANAVSGETTVTLTPNAESPDEFTISDITGGVYSEDWGYGDGENPATVTEVCGELTFSNQPDVVYGGDSFSGDGFIELDGDGNIVSFTINWANGYGDQGVSVYTPAE